MSSVVHKVKVRHREQILLKELLKDERKRIRLYLLICGVLLIVVGFLTSKPHIKVVAPHVASGFVESFSQEPVKVDKNLLNVKEKKDNTKSPPIRILIPALSIDLPVKEAKVVNGYWEVFADSAAFGLGSAYPDEIGNQVIFAHAREGLFLPLRKVKIGQNIMVLTRDKWYSYKIKEIKEVLPNQTDVIAPTKETILTLYTCSGFSDNKRFIVISEKT